MIFGVCESRPHPSVLPHTLAYVFNHGLHVSEFFLRLSPEVDRRRSLIPCATPKQLPLLFEVSLVGLQEAIGSTRICLVKLLVPLDERQSIANALWQVFVGALPPKSKPEAGNSQR
jgi:hypothetical protein